MRLPHAFAIIGVILCQMVCLPASAATDDAGVALQVVESHVKSAAVLPATPPEQVSVHDLRVGAVSVSTRAGWSRQSRERLIDVSGLGPWLGAEFEQRGNLVVYDRPDSGIRAELDLASGRLRADGVAIGQVQVRAVQVGGRLWLGLPALEGLAGQPVAIAGALPPASEAARNYRISQPAEDAKFIQVSTGPVEVLPQAGSEGAQRAALSFQPIATRHSRFEGIFDERIKAPTSDPGRTDWRSVGSWTIGHSQEKKPDTEEPISRSSIASLQPVSAEASASVSRQPVSRASDGKSAKPSSQFPRLRAALGNKAIDHPIASAAVYRPPQSGKISRGLGLHGAALKSASRQLSAPLNELLKPAKSSRPVPVRNTPYRGTDALYGLSALEAVTETIMRSHAIRVPARRPLASGAVAPVKAQLQGTAFLDVDGDGRVGSADQLLEGETYRLIDIEASEVVERRTALFGQFGIADLTPGRYRLEIMLGWEVHSVGIEVPDGKTHLNVQLAVPFNSPVPQHGKPQFASGDDSVSVRRVR